MLLKRAKSQFISTRFIALSLGSSTVKSENLRTPPLQVARMKVVLVFAVLSPFETTMQISLKGYPFQMLKGKPESEKLTLNEESKVKILDDLIVSEKQLKRRTEDEFLKSVITIS